MSKRTKIILAVLVIALTALVIKNQPKENIKTNGGTASSTVTLENNGFGTFSPSVITGVLGKQTCMALFNIERSDTYKSKNTILETEFFETFWGGPFAGKIKNYTPEKNKKFAYFINEMMKEQKIPTYEHLEADVCLYSQDLFNPADGANLTYHVEHRYCTNSCHTGEYDLHVKLSPNGYFIGYRE